MRPHWKALTLALIAVIGETVTDILEPWPIKIVVDNVLQSKKLTGVLGTVAARFFGGDRYAMVNVAVAAVAAIGRRGVDQFVFRKSTSRRASAEWVGHDLRRISTSTSSVCRSLNTTVSRSGDLITRVTSDIEAVRDFINSALLGMLVNVLTLVGMIGVMFYLDWRFTLIALSISPVLFWWSVYASRGGSRRPRVP